LTARLQLGVTAQAAEQIREAAGWWQEHRPAAPGAVHEELERAFDLISLFPGVGAAARNPALQGVRRIHLSRIRYDLYYRVTETTVQVLALWHSSRGSTPAL
jgi:plasmid stabilization system protein ParE